MVADGAQHGIAEMAELGRFLQGELNNEFVAHWMPHDYGLWHPKHTHNLRQLE